VVIKAVRDKKDQTTVAKNNQENGKKVKGNRMGTPIMSYTEEEISLILCLKMNLCR
jgi:hypothetical protein